MICALVKAGRRVGVTATSHKVIRNLLEAVAREAERQQMQVRLGHRQNSQDDPRHGRIARFGDNGGAREAIAGRAVDVMGGTAWLWSRQDFANAVDVLFVDEAGQMALANALAASQAAPALVLLGDPQQLEQPQQASHPDGVGVSALEHVLAGHRTMPAERGLFLPVTWRLGSELCAFTSEVFYEGRLAPRPGLERQRLSGTVRFDGAGLHVVEAQHDGCRSASDEEAETVAAIVEQLLQPGASWVDGDGREHALAPADLLIVAPFNAHVNRIEERLAASVRTAAVRVGTVDRFQGQEAPVVIYSMACSRPEDAPRGLEFLYNLNRLNVATSRARCACILVANPRLFEPDCRTPGQMQLASALARYRELAAGRRPTGNRVS
jgi:uncharacterized protein